MEQIPPMSHINSYGRPGQDAGPKQYYDPRRYPSGDYQGRGSAGNWQDNNYNYHSDPSSESSSFGSTNTPNDFDVQFGDTPLQLGFSSQLDGHYTSGGGQARTVSSTANGYPNSNGYSSPGPGQSMNPYRNGAMSPNNPYNNLNNNGGYAGTGEYHGNHTSPSGSSGPQSPGGVQGKTVPPPLPPQAAALPVPVQSSQPAAPTIAPPEPKKKRGLLKRLSKS